MTDREQLIIGLKEGVARELVEECGKDEKDAINFASHIDLPSKETEIKFICDENTVRIIMGMKGAGYKELLSRDKKPGYVNMQDNYAAFEGWALALHVHLDKNVRLELDTDGEAVPSWDREKPHYNRFLYRLKKFEALYGGPDGWFTLEEDLSAAAAAFGRYLFESGVTFCNNKADGSAGVKGNREKVNEAYMEAAFADCPGLLCAYSGNLFRQLPVGLFEGTVAEGAGVFTGGSSAIDLWGLGGGASGTQLVIYELKLQNKLVGIISELMFYANYTYDMYVEDNSFKPSSPGAGKDLRGYEQLAEAKVTGIRAYMLTDVLHPLITPNVLKEMNRGSTRCHQALKYDALCYDWKEKNGEIVIDSVKSWF